ncbi:MAG: ChpI protein [Leptospiraceae bacterium]|nr:ChpI protein [Leptospiraceae bacterium]
MKTAVSIPDELFEQAEKTAQKMGIPRSQLYARALDAYLKFHNKSVITNRLNAVAERSTLHPEVLASEAGLQALRESLKDDSW